MDERKSAVRRIWEQLKGHFRGYFMSGLLVLVPLLVTIWVLRLIIGAMDHVLLPIVLRPFFPGVELPKHYYGLGAVFTVATVILVGALARSFLMGRLVAFGERLIGRIPFVGVVYSAVKQLTETVVRKEHKDFRRVALVPFPHEGVYSIGFVTGVAVGEVQRRTQERVINVFIPTTPNPTTGFYIMVPEEKTPFLQVTVEDAFKLVMSGGIVSPPEGACEASAQGTTAAVIDAAVPVPPPSHG